MTEQANQSIAAPIELPAVVRFLQEVLGQRMVTLIAGVPDAEDVGKWARGGRLPGPEIEIERRLRHAFQVTQRLAATESAETVRAWFGGMNPELADRPPALVLGEEPAAVIEAARAFLAQG